MSVRASSPVVRFFCETRFVRVLGRRLFPVFRARLSNGDSIYLRSAFNFDASTLEEVYYKNIYERGYAIKPGNVVMDVGAHIGSFTLKAAREVGPSGTVLSFEPSAENFNLLSQNVKTNSYSNARLFKTAVGSEPGAAELRVNKRRGTNSLYENTGMELVSTERVPVTTLDSVAKELNLRKVDFMKIDVEGSELEVLRGATGLLSSSKPAIAMETHDFGPTEGSLASFLDGFGYKSTCIRYHSHLGLLYAQ